MPIYTKNLKEFNILSQRLIISKFNNNRRRISIFAFFLLLIIFFCFSDYGFIKRIELERQSNQLTEEIIQLEQITDSINLIIEKLKFNDYEIERIAREDYGLLMQNEEIYIIKK